MTQNKVEDLVEHLSSICDAAGTHSRVLIVMGGDISVAEEHKTVAIGALHGCSDCGLKALAGLIRKMDLDDKLTLATLLLADIALREVAQTLINTAKLHGSNQSGLKN